MLIQGKYNTCIIWTGFSKFATVYSQEGFDFARKYLFENQMDFELQFLN